MMKTYGVFCVFSFLLHGFEVVMGSLYECPLGWEQYGTRCYSFVFYPTMSFIQASKSCQEDGAELVGLNTKGEDLFLVGWLNRHEKNKANKWWTSGQDRNGEVTWFGEGPFIAPSAVQWRKEEPKTSDILQAIVYAYDAIAGTFKWGKEFQIASLPFICEVSLSDASRIVQQQRDFSYGTDILDPSLIPRGPKFILQPKTITIVGDVKDVSLECEASSFPSPTYKWYRETENNEMVEIDSTQNRFSVTNGKLIIHEPSESLDTGTFRCVASNILGSAISEPGGLNFGFIMEFSNDGGGDVKANLYRGTYLSCDPPMHNPAVNIQWYKEVGGPMFLRTDLQPYQYISYNGKLYFSEVNALDAGVYHCVVTLVPSSGEKLSTYMNPSRTSLGTQLIVQGGSPSEYGPVIHNDFPFVSPSPPLRGNTLILECFAYGRVPLYYSWEKDGGPVPRKSKLMDHGRKLFLPDAQLEDSGNYTCRVRRGNRAVTTKTLYLQVQASPFFVTPMRDKHVDVEDSVVWLCNANGIPEPIYTWYKNAKPVSSSNADGVSVQKNRLVIKNADIEKHEGMYQCEAKNRYGLSMTAVQLRVLSFPPNFAKYPLEPAQVATLGGSVTILCRPEASPKPKIEWQKDGFELSLTDDPNSRVHKLPNGNLLIKALQMSDQGFYQCAATNILGSATSEGHLRLVEKMMLFIAPSDDKTTVNGTVFLSCQATYNAKFQDLVYVWDLNGQIIDVDKDPHYSRGTRDKVPGLHVINAQLHHAGTYRCTATTVYEKVNGSAYLLVQGPPGECSGVRGLVFDRNVTLTWVLGATHGSQATKFHIQFHTNFKREWRNLLEHVLFTQIIDEADTNRCRITISDLKPGSLYSFRVVAMNRFGIGPPSRPSPSYKIPDAAPVLAVEGVTEGVGPVGTLPIVWQELSEEDLTGPGIGYQIYYRKKTRKEGRWRKGVVKGHANSFASVVGAHNYFLEYEVMVGAFNKLGPGPNSSVYVIMSAEDVPIGTPTNVYGDSVNATAIMAYWDPIPNTRTFIRGRILGYQINYWSQSQEDPEVGSTSIYCDCGEGLVVALDPNDDYMISVQVFTNGGMGPLSEPGEGGTYIFPPLTYPEFVSVHSLPGKSVFVDWRGVTTGLLEETLIGYKMRWWRASDNILTANDTIVYDKKTYGVIKGLEDGIVYALRVLGFSAAGDGKKSPTVYFTLEGQVVINPETTAIMNTAKTNEFKRPVIVIFVFISYFVAFA